MHYSTTSTPAPPAPGNPDEARRVEHTRHRYAMMEGRWLPLLEARLEQHRARHALRRRARRASFADRAEREP